MASPTLVGAFVAALAAAAAAYPTTAAAIPLFSPGPTGALSRLQAGDGPREVRVPAATAAALRDRTNPARVLDISIAPGVDVRAERRDGSTDEDVAAWSGDIIGDAEGAADLVVKNGRITGQVTAGGRTWRIAPAGNSDQHRVVPVKERSPVRDAVLIPPGGTTALASPDLAGSTSTLSTTTTTTTIEPTRVRILVAYTPAARASVSDITAEAKLAISMANGAFRRSGVAIKLVLAGMHEVRVSEGGLSFASLLKQATTGYGAFSKVKTKRNTLRADLVSVFIARKDMCGIAWKGPQKDFAVSVVSTSCISYHSFAHEVGHNFGLSHDRYVESAAPVTKYSFGFVNKKARIRDIMSYANACSALGYSCARVPMFSTPRLQYSGSKIGIPAGQAGAADAARLLNANRRTVARFR